MTTPTPAFDAIFSALERGDPLTGKERPLIRVIEQRARNFASVHGEVDVQLSPYLKAMMFKESVNESPRMQDMPQISAGV